MSLLYPYLKHRVRHKKAYKFTFLWTLFAVILLSVIPEKKSRYLMPVLIPLAFNTGVYINYIRLHFKTLKHQWETWPVYVNFTIIAVIALAVPVVGIIALKQLTLPYLILLGLASLLTVCIGVLIIILLLKKKLTRVFLLTVALFVTLTLFAPFFIKFVVSENYQPIDQLNKSANKLDLSVYSLEMLSPEIIWQYGTKIPTITQDNGAIKFATESRFGLLTNKLSTKTQQLLQTHYTLKKTASYNLNTEKKNKDRLQCDYYIVTKKSF